MEFIVIVSTYLDTERGETDTSLHYCQWTGNEEKLRMLCRMIHIAGSDDNDEWQEEQGEQSEVYTYFKKTIPESAVDAHVAISRSMFDKYTGRFECDFLDKVDLDRLEGLEKEGKYEKEEYLKGQRQAREFLFDMCLENMFKK